MKTKKVWVLLANGATGKIYNYIFKDSELLIIKEFSSEDAHLHSSELGTGKPGRSQESIGGLRHSIEPKMDLHKKEKLNFIHLMADYVNHQVNEKSFDQLIICAAPETLGNLRKLIGKQAAALITKEINKDLTHHHKKEIIEHLTQ